MRGEYDAHAGLRDGIRRVHREPKPAPRSLPVLTVAKWVGVVIAVAVAWSLIA